MPKIPLILATRNDGKIAEFKEILSGFHVELRSLKDLGPLPPIVEDGMTFDENAYKKAHLTAKILGFPALADDSGLLVEALGGEPGVLSARYAGEGATDEENNRKLLKAMEGVLNRKATFVCVISIAVPRGPALTYEGICEGEVNREIIGENGFGYDPIFYYPPMRKTFAQMTPDEKNRISHRGKAMADLKREFDKVLLWMDQRMAEGSFL
ncbi:MAG: XTP/dITP diphosphatase [Pseudomonadota bacterium]